MFKIMWNVKHRKHIPLWNWLYLMRCDFVDGLRRNEPHDPESCSDPTARMWPPRGSCKIGSMSTGESYGGRDRREFPRYQANLEARWGEAGVAERDATVTDLGEGGCFVLTGELSAPGKLVRLELRPPAGEALTLWGNVIYASEGIGFALQFVPFSQGGVREKLLSLLRTLRRS